LWSLERGRLSVRLNSGGMQVKAPGAARQGASRPELRALALAAIALGLLGITGLASSAFAWHATRAAAAVGAPTTAVRGLATAGGVVLVGALLLMWIETPKTPSPRRKRRTLAGDELDELGGSLWTAGKTAAFVLLALAIFCIATLPLLSRSPAPSQTPTVAPPAASSGSLSKKSGRAADSLNLGWLLLPMALTFAILTPAAVLIRRRRLQQDQEPFADEPSALDAVQASIAALESEREPRRAILRAYVRMEQAFRNVEIARARDETASEFLGRTMRRLPLSAGAAAALTERFEEARFSTHQLTEADREQALASLRRVEAELAQRP
jgi:Domain of unknown function (DUF4129)